jgi:Tfp pilus assembly protein PilF
MSTTLNLIDHLLLLGRRYQELGRLRDASRLLTRLTAFRELPGEAAEEAQVRLAELCLKRRHFARARRHLTVALRHQPDSARYHHLMATAVLAEDRGDLDRAADHYRRSLALDDTQALCRAEYGLLAVRLGHAEEGIAQLRRAAEQAPDDADVIARAAKGLRLAVRPDEARDVLRAALFRHPKAPRFRKLWHEFQYQQLRRRQRTRRTGRAAGDAEEIGPVLLPFVRPVGEEGPAADVRRDRPATVSPPHLPGRTWHSDQRHAR